MKQISEFQAQAGDFEISWLGCEATWVRISLVTNQFGYEVSWLHSIHIVFFFFSNFPSYTEKYTLCPLKIFYIFENFMLS